MSLWLQSLVSHLTEYNMIILEIMDSVGLRFLVRPTFYVPHHIDNEQNASQNA